MANTYGTWLPGDPRGFRTRRHREHVEGDYQHPPPPGLYDARHRHAREQMKRDPVLLPWDARVVACQVMVESLLFHHVDVVDLAVTDKHLHLLARFTPWPQGVSDEERALIIQASLKPTDWNPWASHTNTPSPPPPRAARQSLPPRRAPARTSALDDPPRHYLGIAKKRSARALAAAHLCEPGGVWAKRGKIVPIAGRTHFLRVVRYVRDHADEGGAVYTLLQDEGDH